MEPFLSQAPEALKHHIDTTETCCAPGCQTPLGTIMRRPAPGGTESDCASSFTTSRTDTGIIWPGNTITVLSAIARRLSFVTPSTVIVWCRRGQYLQAQEMHINRTRQNLKSCRIGAMLFPDVLECPPTSWQHRRNLWPLTLHTPSIVLDLFLIPI